MSKDWKTFDLEDRLVVDFDIRGKHSDCEAREKKIFIIRDFLFDIRYSHSFVFEGIEVLPPPVPDRIRIPLGHRA